MQMIPTPGDKEQDAVQNEGNMVKVGQKASKNIQSNEMVL